MNSFPVQQAGLPQKKPNKIWILVAVVLLLCCLCSLVSVVGGYFYFQNNDAGIGEILDTLVQPSQPNEAKPGEERRVEEGGYALKTLPNYSVDDSSMDIGSFRMYPDDIDYGDPDYTFKAGPAIQISGFVPKSDFTIEEYAANGVEQMSSFYQATISDEPQVSVAGINGIAYDFDYEIPGVGKMKARQINVEVNPRQFFNILCFSTIEKWDKTLADCETVINSITFFEPKPKE